MPFLSLNDERFPVTQEQCDQCSLVSDMLEDGAEDDDVIPLCAVRVTRPALTKLLEFTKRSERGKKRTKLVPDSSELFMNLFQAADYLGCAALVDQCGQALVEQAKSLSTAEFNRVHGLGRVVSAEEERQLQEDYPWISELLK